ncbi:MAG: pentapeptide repeat-containing protein [Kiloniellales bacterium]|nr:pentapeptide repeat-containing protein [Kiloniellales bacterium]
MTDSKDHAPEPEAPESKAPSSAPPKPEPPRSKTAKPGEASGAASRRRSPIPIRWHHTGFDLTVASVQAAVAAVTMAIALLGAFFIHDEYQDRRQARMTRAWELLHSTREIRFFNSGQIEALQSLHLSGANLRRVNLESRYLEGIELRGADFYDAHFSAANLAGADLRDTVLHGARMDIVNLTEARLDGADMSKAILSRARLIDASLRGVDLTEAVLAGTNLSGANLRRARGLTAEQLAGACATPERPPELPDGLPPPPACE